MSKKIVKIVVAMNNYIQTHLASIYFAKFFSHRLCSVVLVFSLFVLFILIEFALQSLSFKT